MKRRNSLPELLCPAGNTECLYAAVEGGADAVYVGGKRFGARAFAGNFDEAELIRAVNYCHLRGVKLYVTVNTLIEDSELSCAVEYCRTLYRIGVDAVIIADVGLISLLRKYVPRLELHASTQLSAHNSLGADEAYRMGCERVVLARELPLSDIVRITAECKAEIEVFLHGALCVCHSGQCLFSSLVGGRSGNRGECAQPCRLPYEGDKYPLSLRDLCLAGHIKALVDSGVSSVKIEGRMKSADYVYTVTSVYRRLLDECRSATPEEEKSLKRAFSRGGFTDGYFTGRHGEPMCGIRSDADKNDSRAASGRSFAPIRKTVRAEAKFKLGEPSELMLSDGVRTVRVTGETPTEAKNAPLTKEALRGRLSKMGNTLLSLPEESIELTLDDGINLPPSAINALRRAAAERFESSEREDELPPLPEGLAGRCRRETPLRTAELLRAETFAPEMAERFDIVFLPLFSEGDVLRRVQGVHLPPIIFESELEKVKKALEAAKNEGVLYALVNNIGQITLVKSCGLIPFGGFRLNITNSAAREAYRELGIERAALSPELTLPKARDIGGSVTVYGRIPLMVTERCFIKENFGCERCDKAFLTDRRGERFPLMREFEHRNLILNSAVTYMGDKRAELARMRIDSEHFIFTNEIADQALRALRAYDLGAPLTAVAVRRVGRRDPK